LLLPLEGARLEKVQFKNVHWLLFGKKDVYIDTTAPFQRYRGEANLINFFHYCLYLFVVNLAICAFRVFAGINISFIKQSKAINYQYLFFPKGESLFSRTYGANTYFAAWESHHVVTPIKGII